MTIKCSGTVLLDPGQSNWSFTSTHQYKDPQSSHPTSHWKIWAVNRARTQVLSYSPPSPNLPAQLRANPPWTNTRLKNQLWQITSCFHSHFCCSLLPWHILPMLTLHLSIFLADQISCAENIRGKGSLIQWGLPIPKENKEMQVIWKRKQWS